MIQDIAPHKLHMEYHPEKRPEKSSKVMLFRGRNLLCSLGDDGNLRLPDFEEFTSGAEGSAPGAEKTESGFEFTYLFAIDDQSFFLAREKGGAEGCGKQNEPASALEFLPEGYDLNDINLFRTASPKELAMASVTAYHLSVWYSSNAYCGRCGTKTVHDSSERMMRCPECGNMIFPKIMPSVIVGVINGDKLLLERYNRPGAKLGALVAGFTEIGETVEDTVIREVREEVGLEVKDLRFYKSQPWGISGGGLLFGFWCTVDGSDEIHADGAEIAEAQWKTRQQLREEFQDAGISLTSEMIRMFANGEERQ